MDRLIEEHASLVKEGQLGGGGIDTIVGGVVLKEQTRLLRDDALAPFAPAIGAARGDRSIPCRDEQPGLYVFGLAGLGHQADEAVLHDVLGRGAAEPLTRVQHQRRRMSVEPPRELCRIVLWHPPANLPA